jgi:hypothetical protein
MLPTFSQHGAQESELPCQHAIFITENYGKLPCGMCCSKNENVKITLVILTNDDDKIGDDNKGSEDEIKNEDDNVTTKMMITMTQL